MEHQKYSKIKRPGLIVRFIRYFSTDRWVTVNKAHTKRFPPVQAEIFDLNRETRL
jgi:hypothetical protein